MCVVVFLNAQVNPCQKAGMPYSSVPGDTTITLLSGTQITFNRCEYFDIRDCISITEIDDTAGLRRNRLTMYDENGNVLETCGMVGIQLNDCGKSCFDVPIKIKVRVRFTACSNETGLVPRLYVANGGVWSLQPEDKVKKVVENGVTYMEFSSHCSLFINCDVKKPGREVKFIAPKGSKIETLRIGRNCPLFFTDTNYPKLKRRQKAKIYCGEPDKTTVQAVLVNEQSDRSTTAQMKLSDLQSGGGRIKCRKSKKKERKEQTGMLPNRKIPKSNTRRKYFLPAGM